MLTASRRAETDELQESARHLAWHRIFRHRYPILLFVAGAAAVAAGGRGDWNVFVGAGRAMLDRGGLEVFVHHGDIQTGPLTLLTARLLSDTPRGGFVLCVVVCGALGLLTIRTVEKLAMQVRDQWEVVCATTLIGGPVLLFWWSKLASYGHIDDAAVLTLAVVALHEVRTRSRIHAGLLLGVAIAFKPWAVVLLPLLLVRGGSWHRRLRPMVVGLAVGGLPWLPFLIADPDTLRSIRTTVHVSSGSVIRLFGFSDANVPSWLRIAQLLGALSIAFVAVWRRSSSGVILAALAVRIATDPGTWSYYTVGLVLGAFIWDVLETRSVIPWATLVGSALLAPTWLIRSDDGRAAMRLFACVLAVSVVLVGRPLWFVSAPARRAGRCRPSEDQLVVG
ncbi:MAG: hypothetical protein JWN39_3640 [Ilumatobacteraceae bacterium]|nr:hypothetical protein [Ilumatobacteraceae bacterium]